MHPTETGIYYTFFAGLGGLIVLVLLFVHSLYRQQKFRIKVMKQQLLREMTLIEEERSRIASDLHDHLGSTLSHIRMGLMNIQDEPNQSTHIQKSINHIEDAQALIKEIAHNLMPGILKAWGLCAAINELVEESIFIGHTKIHFNNDCDDSSFLSTRSVIVFRIIQEVLNNALKHSKATQIVIYCSTAENLFTLEIKDNGKGFDQNKRHPLKRHTGLENIKSRVDLLGAKYLLESEPGKGTRYFIQIPLIIMSKTDDERFNY